ncbi:MAG: GFA family protein [Rhodospirillaceae bacterium]|nr:GFA family protein [Rhodospirillaceae bacterium]
MATISGKCLCGGISYESDNEPMFTANCHCSDCRAATGAAYSTLSFFKSDDVKISGETKSYQHVADSGSQMIKRFCPNCGSQLFGENSAREGMISVRAGTIDQVEMVKPARNVYCGSKIPSTPLDPELPASEKMPEA